MLASSRTTNILLVMVLAVGIAIVAMLATVVRGGSLDPPGPVASTQSKVIYQPASCAGFPIVISTPGSYRLGGNITGCAGKDGIQLTTGNITLDLGGFIVVGVVGSLDGVKNLGVNGQSRISNGTILAWGGDGLDLADAYTYRVDHIIANYNLRNGIVLGPFIALHQVTATANGLAGIYAGPTSWNVTVTDCNVDSNGSLGIVTQGYGAVVDSCEVGTNTGGGISVGESARVVNNHAHDNTGEGITAGSYCHLENNSASSNSGSGISLYGTKCNVVRNSLTHNTVAPIYVQVSATLNYIDNNTAPGLNRIAGDFNTFLRNLGRPEIESGAIGNEVGQCAALDYHAGWTPFLNYCASPP